MGNTGKRVGQRLYVSSEQITELDEPARDLVARARALISKRSDGPFNVLRVDVTTDDVAFLHYPDLGLKPFPALASSCRVNVTAKLVRQRSYESSLNPPILHRTELLLREGHPARQLCETLTSTCESLGLFENPTSIGFKLQWEALIAQRGFVLDGFNLVPLANAPASLDTLSHVADGEANVERHLTALARTSLSAPVQSLLRDKLLTPSSSFFDYGCGRGDDVTTLVAAGYIANGWDPHYKPDSQRVAADVVNLGFVINVIEDRQERVDVLEGAYALTKRVLAVAAMLGSNEPSKGRLFGDGVLTSRSTFQKYYSQGELRAFIESVLDEEAYPAAPGIFYVFRDRSLEQQYLLTKSSNGSRVQRLLAQVPVHVRNISTRERSERPTKSAPSRTSLQKKADSVEAQRELATLWQLILELGRIPDSQEIPTSAALKKRFGTVKRAIEICLGKNDANALRRAEQDRREDILVMYALRMFDRRRRFGKLESRLAKDVRTFFGSVSIAESEAKRLLFSIQDIKAIEAACECSAKDGLGWLEPGESLQLHTSLLPRLPAILRVYIGCATVMAGDISAFDLVKAHIGSGKVSLMVYDDFFAKPLPLLLRRVKVRLRDQELDIFDYDERYPPPVLFRKSRYINEEFPHYADQIAFEEELAQLRVFDLDDYGPPEQVLLDRLASRRYVIDGFHLARATDVPHVDSPCGANFRFRDFLECGETWIRERPGNVPRLAETYNALCDLAVEILDPVIEYFGAIELTYGFASPALTKHIPGRIAPDLDQHASCEVRSSGKPICSRRGASVDFIVRDEDMAEVAKWIDQNCNYDRMYFYGSDRPLHVSVGPEHSRLVYKLADYGSCRVPQRVDINSI